MRSVSTAVFLAVACVAVALAVAVGLKLVGGPGQARMRHLDGERVAALTRLASDIDAYRRGHGGLPATLEGLAAQRNDLPEAQLRDPETGAPYEYRATGPAAYELCAAFAAPSDEEVAIRWRHGRGRTCFALAAD